MPHPYMFLKRDLLKLAFHSEHETFVEQQSLHTLLVF